MQACLVTFAIVALSAIAAASETSASQNNVQTTSADETAANVAAEAAQLLASMPACGVCYNKHCKLYFMWYVLTIHNIA